VLLVCVASWIGVAGDGRALVCFGWAKDVQIAEASSIKAPLRVRFTLRATAWWTYHCEEGLDEKSCLFVEVRGEDAGGLMRRSREEDNGRKEEEEEEVIRDDVELRPDWLAVLTFSSSFAFPAEVLGCGFRRLRPGGSAVQVVWTLHLNLTLIYLISFISPTDRDYSLIHSSHLSHLL
jgi:hypothetical protein